MHEEIENKKLFIHDSRNIDGRMGDFDIDQEVQDEMEDFYVKEFNTRECRGRR